MNLYELSIGNTKRFIVAESEEDAYKQGTDPAKFPDLHYLPFTITPIVVPGFVITVTPEEADNVPLPKVDPNVPLDDEFDSMDKAALVEWFKSNNVEYTPQWGEKRLREAARAHKAAE